MTDYEAYLIARGQLWKQELEAFDGAVVAQLLKSMRQIRREVEAQIDALDLSSPADLLDKERLERLEAWIDSVTAAASSITEGIAVEAGISSALASATATVAMLSLDGAISAFRDVGLTREQLAVWYADTAELVEGYSLRGLLQGMSAQAKQTVLDSLRTSVTMGESIQKGVDRLLRDAMEAGLEMTERGAVSTVRTAIQAGAVQAMDKVYEGNRDLIAKWRWIAKLDSRVCPVCAARDSQIYEFEKGPTMPAHPRCLMGETPVYAPDNIAAFVAPYRGPVVDIRLSSGARLTVTVNHMFLTPNGFAPAKALRKGDYVFFDKQHAVLDLASCTGGVRPYNNRKPARIDEIVRAFSEAKGVSTHRVPLASEDLHGDAEFGDGYVDVIAPDCLLRGDAEAFRDQFLRDFPLIVADGGAIAFSPLGDAFDPRFRLWNALGCGVSGLSVAEILCWSPLAHHQAVRNEGVPRFDAVAGQGSSDAEAGYAEMLRQAQLRFARFIPFADFFNGARVCDGSWLASMGFSRGAEFDSCFDKGFSDNLITTSDSLGNLLARIAGGIPTDYVVDVKTHFVSTHVYDLQTLSTLYYANGALTSNCRCLKQPILRKNADLGIPDADVQRLSRRWIEREKGNIDMGGRKILDVQQTDRWFGEWFPSLRPDMQDSILGPTRANALRSGSISWSDLTDKDGKFRTLKELGLSRIDRRSGKQ